MTQDTSELAVTLEPCPHCGSDAHWCPTYIDTDEPGTVTCAGGCGATVICSGSKAERIAAWNRRSLTDSAQQPAPAGDAELRKVLSKVMPIRVNAGPDYADVYFADGSTHSTHAMTMNPQDWLDLQAAYDTATPPSVPAQQGWLPIETAVQWDVAIVTDGESIAVSQLCESDHGEWYWSREPEDVLWFEPTHWRPDDRPATPPAQDQKGEEGR